MSRRHEPSCSSQVVSRGVLDPRTKGLKEGFRCASRWNLQTCRHKFKKKKLKTSLLNPDDMNSMLVFDESYAEHHPHEKHSSGSTYMYKDLEKVWIAQLDPSCCSSLCLYITCSAETVWNGKDNLIVMTAFNEDQSDTELQEYLDDLLKHLAAHGSQDSNTMVLDYLKEHHFCSKAAGE